MTLSEIARLAGVSKATASRAFSNPAMVSEETRSKVLEIAHHYNFRPNTLAQAVASRKSSLIGFCLYNKNRPYFGHTFFGPILDGAIEQAKEMGYHIVPTVTNREDDRFEERFIEDGIEGALLSTSPPEKTVEIFRSRGIPAVVINDELAVPHTGYIIDDNYGGAKKLMAHLIDQRGYRSIAIVTDRLSHSSYLPRYLGYLDALSERGVPPYSAPELPQYNLTGSYREFNHMPLLRLGLRDIPYQGTPVILSDTMPEAAYACVQPLLNCAELPRAIFCTADHIAIGVMKAIHDRGLRVPEDIAVCGYDDVREATFSEPPITTIRVNRNGIGREAIRLLKAYIDDPDRPSETICMENQLIIRQST